jgi:hypothetical protein
MVVLTIEKNTNECPSLLPGSSGCLGGATTASSRATFGDSEALVMSMGKNRW